jgi:hypothetical protein
MQVKYRRTNSRKIRCRNAGEEQREWPEGKKGYTPYAGIDDFLRAYPIAAFDRYGDNVISGRRIC